MKQRRRPILPLSTTPPLFYAVLCIIIVFFTPYIPNVKAQDQSIAMLDTSFNTNTNFTQCSNLNTFTVHDLNRTYDHTTNTFYFNMSGHSSIAMTNLNEGQNQYSSARTEVVIGFTAVMDQRRRLCPTLNNTNNGCPIAANSDVFIQQSFTVPETSLPLADIITRYSTLTADGQDWICITMAPVGYENPTWKIVFTYIPVAFTIFAALVSFFASFATVSEAEHDALLFSSNYAMLPAALRLKSPGFFDLIYYAQYIVLTAQLNLNYPGFYQLFASNFAWSFLIFPTQWLQNINNSIFPYNEEVISHDQVVTLLEQQQNTSSVIVEGYGMTNFANAVDIDVNILFLGSFLYMLMILAGCLLLCFLIWVVVQIMGWHAPHRYAAQTPKIVNFTIGIILRVLTLFYLPMMVLGFFQLMLPAPWYLSFTAALVLVFHIFLIYGGIAFVLLDVRPPSLVFSDITLLLRYGCLYNTFTDESFYFFLCDLVYRIFIGAMVGWFSVSGVAQMVVLLLFETAYFALHILQRPYASRHVNFQHILFGAFRLVILFLNIAYVDTLDVLDRNKQAIAYTQVTLHCIVFLFMFVFPIRNLVVLLTGLADDEIYETGTPPARMAFWRINKNRPFGSGRRRNGGDVGHHHRVPTNDELDKFTEQHQQRVPLPPAAQKQQQQQQQQEYQQLQHHHPPERSQQEEPMMEVISLHDEPAPPVTFTAINTGINDNSNNSNSIIINKNRPSHRSSLPPPPPPPHGVKPNIEQRNGWKISGKNRHSLLGMNIPSNHSNNDIIIMREQQETSSAAGIIQPLMMHSSDYHNNRQQRPSSWNSISTSNNNNRQQRFVNDDNNIRHNISSSSSSNNNSNNNPRPYSFQ